MNSLTNRLFSLAIDNDYYEFFCKHAVRVTTEGLFIMLPDGTHFGPAPQNILIKYADWQKQIHSEMDIRFHQIK